MKAGLKNINIGGALLLCACVAGCAADSADQLFIRPGRFDYLSCAEIAATVTKTSEKQRELQTLTERAERESVGVLMATMSYRGDQLRLEGEQKMLAEVARRKNCAAQSPAPGAAGPSRR